MKKTIKLPIQITEEERKIVLDYQKNQNNLINRLKENNKLFTKEITELQKEMNNIFVDSHFKNSAIYKARELMDRDRVIFGGKKLFISRCQNKISKEEFQLKKLLPIISIGESSHKGNRKFSIQDNNTILFKADRKTHIELGLPILKRKMKKEMDKILIAQENYQIPIT